MNPNHSGSRRVFLLAITTGSLSACGFQPRGSASLPPELRRVSLAGSQPSGLTQALERLLRQGGAEIISTLPKPGDSLNIRVNNVQLQRREALIDRQANVRQIELIQRAQLNVSRADNIPLIEHEAFEAVRSTSYNPLSLLAQGEEEQRLQRELDEQMAQTILARLRSRLATPAP
jgi:LPS-assembly lipoprotein